MKRSGCAKWLKRGCLGTIALVVVGVAGGYLFVRREFSEAGSTLAADLEALRGMGVATDHEDLARLTEVPEEENAAPNYRQAISVKGSMGGDHYGRYERVLLGDLYPQLNAKDAEPPPSMAEARERLAPILRLVEKAAQKPKCSWGREWQRGFDLGFPEYAELKAFAKLLCAEAAELAREGRIEEAFAEVGLAQRIGAHASMEPTLIGGLVGIAIDSIALAAWGRILDARRDDPRTIRLAQETVDGFLPLSDLRFALMGELVAGRRAAQTVRSIRQFDSTGSESPPIPSQVEQRLMSDPLVRKGFDGKCTAAYRRLFEAWPKDPMDFRGQKAALEALDRSILADRSMAGAFNRIVFPVFAQASAAYARDEAQRRMAQAAVWALEQKAANGSLPERLEPVGLNVIDPFSGEPLRYKTKEGGFLIYSVGANEKDDGGTPRSAPHFGDAVDDVMAFPRSLLPKPPRYPGVGLRPAQP